MIAADVSETELLSIELTDADFFSVSKAAYEIGNCHAPLFAGEKEGQLITIYTEPMERLFKNLHGINVKVEKKFQKLDFSKQISSIVGHSHHHSAHEHGHDGGHHDSH